MATQNIIRERLDSGGFSPVMALVVGIGFILNLVDGFDVIAMSVAAPALTAEWGNINDKQLGWILSSALFGMAIGAAVVAPYADRLGRRIMLLASTIVIGICMVGTGITPRSVEILIILRFFTGLGVGVILASGAAIASEFAPEKYRNLAVAIAITGYPFGALLVGPVAQHVIPTYGWEMLFIGGGVMTLLIGLFVFIALPESIEFLLSRKTDREDALAEINKILHRLGRVPIDALPAPVSEKESGIRAGKVSSLLTSGLRLDTLCLWTIFFMTLLSLYFLFTWIPTLFVQSGYTRSEGIRALTFFNFGALVGIMFIGYWITKAKIARAVGVYLIGTSITLTALYGLRPTDLTMLNGVIFITGFFIQAAFTACYSLAARVYQTEIRTTGIGWSAGLGRVGAIVSPIVTGFLVSSDWDMYHLFLLFAVPVFIAGLITLRFRV